MNQMMGWSFSAGHVAGIPVRVHWTLVLLSAFWVLREPTPSGMGWQLAVCAVLWFTVLIHELGHAFAARGVGGEARGILLWPLGGLAYTSHSGGLKEDIKVILGGPLTHIPLALLFARLLMFQGVPWDWGFLHPLTDWPILTGGFWAYVCFYGLKIQVALFLFNLFVPTYPLDGGHLLVDLMLFRFSRERAAQAIMVLSLISGVVLLLLGQLFLPIWVFYELYQLSQYYKRKALAQHPLFARVPSVPVRPARPAPTGGVVLKFKGRKSKEQTKVIPAVKPCPYCGKELPSAAVMCGRCEKMLPST